MKELFLAYAREGAMTVDELAQILRRKPSWVRDNSRGRGSLIPRLPGYPIRFDPLAMIDVFCQPPKPERSLKIERHKTGVTTKGGYKCLL